jgi:hypothetical protein
MFITTGIIYKLPRAFLRTLPPAFSRQKPSQFDHSTKPQLVSSSNHGSTNETGKIMI